MTQAEKIEAVAQIFELAGDAIKPDTALSSLAWDSMAMISVIALVNARFGKRISGAQIKEFKTVADILDFMK